MPAASPKIFAFVSSIMDSISRLPQEDIESATVGLLVSITYFMKKSEFTKENVQELYQNIIQTCYEEDNICTPPS